MNFDLSRTTSLSLFFLLRIRIVLTTPSALQVLLLQQNSLLLTRVVFFLLERTKQSNTHTHSMLASARKTSRYLVLGASTAGVGAAVYRYRQILRRQHDELPTQDLPVFTDNKIKTKTTTTKPPVLIIGGGVVGVTAAYKLARAGHAVALCEPASRVATECSACAAGGMQRSVRKNNFKG